MAYVSRITSHNNNGNTSATRHRNSTRVQLYTLLYSLQAKGPVHVRRSFAPHGRLLQAKTARSSCLPHGSIFTSWKLSIEAAAFPSEYCNAPRFVYRPRGRGRSGIAYIVSAAKGASSSKERPRKSKSVVNLNGCELSIVVHKGNVHAICYRRMQGKNMETQNVNKSDLRDPSPVRLCA